MFRQLLVPLDFSDKNEGAIDIAIETARRDGAEVTLLHVIETIDHMDFDEMSDFYRKLETRAAAKLAVLTDRFTGPRPRHHQLPGGDRRALPGAAGQVAAKAPSAGQLGDDAGQLARARVPRLAHRSSASGAAGSSRR